MSGIEVAPIILKSLPALFQAANAVLPLVQGGKDWYKFDIAYKRFIGDIRTERITYEQNLKIFLGPLEVDLEGSTALYKDANAPLWYDLAMQDRIERRIGLDQYDWFLGKLRCMDATIKSLHDMLPKQNGKLQALESGTTAYEINRFKNSFSIDKQPLIDTLKSVNSEINRFVLNLDRIENQKSNSFSKHSPSSKHIQVFRTLQKQAKTMFAALHDQIKCGGNHSHHCGVMADWSRYQSSLEAPSIVLMLHGSSHWRSMRYSLNSGGHNASENTAAKKIENEIDQYDVQLRKQEWRANLVEAAKTRKIGIATVSATSAILNPKEQKTDALWLEREITKVTKTSKRKLKEPGVSKTLSIRRAAWSIRQRSPKSSLNVAPAGHGTAGGSSSSEITSSHEIKGAGIKTTTSTNKKNRPVQFEQHESSLLSSERAETSSSQVTDICAFLSPEYMQSHREHINLEVGTMVFELVTPSQDTHNLSSTIGLEEVFTQLRDLKDRIQIGVELVRTIIGFAGSGWISHDWDRRGFSIVAKDSENERAYDTYIPRLTSSFGPPRKLSVEQTRLILFSLGAALLELHDAKFLEKTKEWETYSANELSIISRLRIVAGDRLQKMHNRHGESLSEPIRRCLNYGFMKSTQLEDVELLAEVVNGVLKPLESFIVKWAQGPPR